MRLNTGLAGLLIVVAASFGACTNNSDAIPCGEADPDPCICARPDIGPAEAALCSEQTSCEAKGGIFDPTRTGADGGYGICSVDAGSPDDAGVSVDGAGG